MKWQPRRMIHHLEQQLQTIPTWLFVGAAVLVLSVLTLCVDKEIEEENIHSVADALDRPKVVARVLIDDAESIAIVVAVIIYLKGAPDRRAQKHYEAWRVIDSAAASGMPTSFARYQALKDLHHDGVSLQSLDAPGANLEGIALPKADLSKSNLQRANLQNANLKGANLEGANLEGTNLQNADLTGAKLNGANLRGAVLRHAELWKVQMIEADLTEAELRWAAIDEEELVGAKLHSTIMPNGSVRD